MLLTRRVLHSGTISNKRPVSELANQSTALWPPSPRSQEIDLPGPFNRKMFVYNCRNVDGRTRTTTLAVTTAKHRPVLFLNREEFEGLMQVADEIKAELINFQKKI